MRETKRTAVFVAMLFVVVCTSTSGAQTVHPSGPWKNAIVFPQDPFANRGLSRDSASWIKFTILLKPYDSSVVYFQDSRNLVYHYSFGTQYLEPFAGMTQGQFNAATLFAANQQAILGTVVFPPGSVSSAGPLVSEVGIQFVRQDVFARDDIVALCNTVISKIEANSEVSFYYFPTFEQQSAAEADREWFAAQGIPLGSTAQWAKGNVCYSEGWSLGRLKFVGAENIHAAYQTGELGPLDILLTNGIPAELPPVAGILSLAPSTPNSHVAILAQTYAVPFAFLSLAEDAALAQSLDGHTVIFSAYANEAGGRNTRLLDVSAIADEAVVQDILALKEPEPLKIVPMQFFGAYHVSTESLQPGDVCYAGGKASNSGILRHAIPEHSPVSMAFTFDLWNAFLEQTMRPTPVLTLEPGDYMILWADGKSDQGVTHLDFKLSKGGESLALSDRNGIALDALHFDGQIQDVSFGRSSDGSDVWQSFPVPTPGGANSNEPPHPGAGLVINEFMASNSQGLEDPNNPGSYPDWIELYNGSDAVISLNGLFLSDDVNNPMKWQIPHANGSGTLRQEITARLAHFSFPPSDIGELNRELAIIRQFFVSADITPFSDTLQAGVLDALTDPLYGFEPNALLRFRSSTNVEDGDDYTGAGLYDSYSACLADDLRAAGDGTCACDPNRDSQRSVLKAIRKTYSSFYNENAFLERLRRDVNELDVGMALLVHHSFPDDHERANGVATIARDSATGESQIELVTQLGATSVTNPVDGSIPEQITLRVYADGNISRPRVQLESSLVPRGGMVMDTIEDYVNLANLIATISDAFRALTNKLDYTLDLEYKKVGSGDQVRPEGGLIVKQVRQVPEPNAAATSPTFLLNKPARFEIYPGEFHLMESTDIFADHRLKSRWILTTRNMAISGESLNEGIYAELEMEYVADGRMGITKGPMSLLPYSQHEWHEDQGVLDRWALDSIPNPRSYELKTVGIPLRVPDGQDPLCLLSDFGEYAFNVPYRCHELKVQYEFPVVTWDQHDWLDDPASAWRHGDQNRLYLWLPPEPSPDDVPVQREYLDRDRGISVRTSFFWPPPPPGYSSWIVHTAPLLRWEQTVIEGLVDEPIVLRGYYSQTIRPEHHNLTENYLFEPALEPGISDGVLNKLKAIDVQLIHLTLDNMNLPNSRIVTYGESELR